MVSDRIVRHDTEGYQMMIEIMVSGRNAWGDME